MTSSSPTQTAFQARRQAADQAIQGLHAGSGPLAVALALAEPGVREQAAALAALPGVAVLDLAPVLAGDSPADAVLIQAGPGDPAPAFEQARDLLARGAAREVFLAGPPPAPETLLAAMRLGVQEYLVLPLDPAELAAALERLARRRPAPAQDPQRPAVPARTGRILCVLGAKPGVGTTTLAVNLAHAAALASPGRVALLDLRRGEGEVPLFLDLDFACTWADAAENLSRLDATFLQSVMARHASGLSVLPAPGPDQPARLSPAEEARALARVLGEMAARFDQVVVDAGSLADDAAWAVMDLAGTILMPLVLSLPGLARARRLLGLVQARDPALASRVRLAANRCVDGGDIEPAEAEAALGQPMAWSLPEDSRAALSAVNLGRPLALAAPKSGLTRGLERMARELLPPQPAAAPSAPGLRGQAPGTGRFSLRTLFRPKAAPVLPCPRGGEAPC